MSYFLEVFEAGDGESGGSETVVAGVLGAASLASGSARSSALGRVGAIGCVLLFRDGHELSFRLTDSMIILGIYSSVSQVMGREGVISLMRPSPTDCAAWETYTPEIAGVGPGGFVNNAR